MILAPDENQKAIYENQVDPNLKQGATLAFAHGFNVHYPTRSCSVLTSTSS